MKDMKTIIGWIIGGLVLLLAGCDKGHDEVALPEEGAEIVFSGTGEEFVQTRADAIGLNDTGPQFGDIHILRKTVPETDIEWGLYHVPSGTSGSLTAKDEESKLCWEKEREMKYTFFALSVPPAAKFEDGQSVESSQAGVEFAIREDNKVEGKVTYGDYTKGLEYFVGCTVADKERPGNLTVSMTFVRQVCKLVFEKISYHPRSGGNIPVEECTIIFPNLPSRSTFNMEEMHPNDMAYGAPGIKPANCHYVTLHDDESVERGITMDWKKRASDKIRLYHALYVPPFKFWGADSERPEEQPGFFVVLYDNKSFTGNIYGINVNGSTGEADGKIFTEVFQSDLCLFKEMILKDGPGAGGGDGSAILPWNVKPEEDVPHHRLPGIYTQDDAERLLQALRSGKEEDIPVMFYKEEEIDGEMVKVIRLFKNIDWSAVIGTELTIPKGFVLMGQGYNVTLGDGTSIKGEQEGKLYINGVLHEDGQGPTAFLLHTFCSATANVLQSHCI